MTDIEVVFKRIRDTTTSTIAVVEFAEPTAEGSSQGLKTSSELTTSLHTVNVKQAS
jgi:hypothetical protein